MAGYVYITQAENGRVKIGIAKDVIKRHQTIEACSPLYVYLLHHFEAKFPWHVERMLHAFFERFRHHGEWFDLSDAQTKWLCSLSDDDYDEIKRLAAPYLKDDRVGNIRTGKWQMAKAHYEPL